MDAPTLLSGLDPTAGTIVVAAITAASALALRWFPKTRSEAGVERANARLLEAQALATALESQAKELTRAHARVDELENALEEERRECDRRIDQLEREGDRRLSEVREELAELRARLPEA